MKKFLTILTAAVLCLVSVPFTACQKADYTVGIVQLVTHPALDAATDGFKDALTEKLNEAGRTVEFDYQNASNESAMCSTIANGFVSKKVDLIMANATSAVQAAYNATSTIPIIGTSVTDYGVALGIKDFNGTVGGNVSGTADLAPLKDQLDKEGQVSMMVSLLGLTAGKKVAILYCSAEANSKYQADVVKADLEGRSITADIKTFTDSNDIASVCNGIVSGGYDAVYVPTDNTVAANTSTIDNILRLARIPVFAGEEGICSGCGFATLSISYYNIGKKAGEMAADVLLGREDIRELAISYDQSPVKKYNATIAADLGIEIPEDYIVISGTEIAEN